MPTDFSAVLCAALFVLPGYIALVTANSIAPHYTKSSMANLLNCMAYSFVLSFFLSDEITRFANSLNASSLAAEDWQVCGGKAFFYALILGVVIGLVRRWGWLRSVCALFRINVNTSPTAWDFKFSSIDETKYLEVVLNDGRVVRGRFSTGSYASSVEDEGGGLFLEDAYVGEDWEHRYKSDGMYIAANAIQTVEFFDSGDASDEQESRHEQ